jgi:hypothetical protein
MQSSFWDPRYSFRRPHSITTAAASAIADIM